jgi:hypothetical protein
LAPPWGPALALVSALVSVLLLGLVSALASAPLWGLA